MQARMMRREREPAWVAAQHKTLVRWVNSRLHERQVNDLSTDLRDGLVLIELVNSISGRQGSRGNKEKRYTLKALYPKPTFKLQMIENLNDSLKFCQLILKINLLNVSGDNIYEGDLKLILGLIWSLFIYSTNTSMFIKESASYTKIKELLLKWVNDIICRKNLAVANFNRDWSLEVNRPDFYLSVILEHYTSFRMTNQRDKVVQSLEEVLRYAESMGISKIVEVDDFLGLVPEEKSIVTFLAEWYTFLEVEGHTIEPEVGETNLDSFVTNIVILKKWKNIYETESLSTVNRINKYTYDLTSKIDFIKSSSVSVIAHLQEYFDRLLATAKNFENMNELLGAFHVVKGDLERLRKVLNEYQHFRSALKPKMQYKDMPDLELLFGRINSNLSRFDRNLNYTPITSLQTNNISRKFDNLLDVDATLLYACTQYIKELYEKTRLNEINSYLDSMKDVLSTFKDEIKSDKKEPLLNIINSIDYLIGINHKIDFYKRDLGIKRSPSELKELLESTKHEEYHLSGIDSSAYKFFKKQFSNCTGLSIFELNKALKPFLSSSISKSICNTFIKLIPYALDENDSDFTLLDVSDESDDSYSVFDGIQRRLDSKLLGDDRLYNINSFITNIENKFSI